MNKSDYKVKNKWGSKYEKAIAKNMKYFFGETFCNLIFDYGLPNETEVDMVTVTKKGLFVSECKYRSTGSHWLSDTRFIGGLEDKNWNLSSSGTYSEELYSPLFQNEGHIERLRWKIPNAVCFNVFTSSVHFSIHYFGINHTSGGSYNSSEKDDSYPVYIYERCKYPVICMYTDLSYLPTVKAKKDSFRILEDWYIKLPDVYTDEEVAAIKNELKKYIPTKEQFREFKKRKMKQVLTKE